MKTIDLGGTFIGHFPVFADDGVTKVSGETVFEDVVWHDGVPVAVSVSFDEIGVSGEYRVTLTPTAEGNWSVEVHSPTSGQRWYDEFYVVTPALRFGMAAVDNNTAATFSVWLDRDGQRQVDIASVAAVIRGDDGTSVLDLGTDSAPTAEGVFTFSCASSALGSGLEYHLDLTATRGASAWYGNLGFAKL